MYEHTHVIWQAWPPTAQTLAGNIALAALSLLLAACSHGPSATGSGPSSNSGGPAADQAAFAFSRGMRSHGMANWPDPTTDAEGRPYLPVTSAGIPREMGSQQFKTEARDCRREMPDTSGMPVR
jgi:hypothetical protein